MSLNRKQYGGKLINTACRVFVNKMDRMGADFFRCVDMFVDRLGANPLVMQLPIGAEADFMGLVDLVKMKAIIWKDESLGAEFEEVDIPDDLTDMAPISRNLSSLRSSR